MSGRSGTYEFEIKPLDFDALMTEYEAGNAAMRRLRRVVLRRWIETDEARRHAQVEATLRLHGRLPAR